MKRSRVSIFACCVLVTFVTGSSGSPVLAVEDGTPEVCRPSLGLSPAIELGKAGVFTWNCAVDNDKGKGFYIVFIRPAGTYVLLKVPQGRTSFEFTPDTPGTWRWIVINTDPDRTKPDVESKPGTFQVIGAEESAR
jgi:hypothetical protein